LFPKQTRAELTQKQSLRLRETDLGNRLTIDVDAERIDLASGASEVEREWLAQLLARRYALSRNGCALTKLTHPCRSTRHHLRDRPQILP
jgi:hypothetical protein